MATTRLPRDVHYLCRHIEAHSNGQAKVAEVDDNMQFLMLEVIPTDGYYRGAKLHFKLQFPEAYPQDPPIVVCLDNVYHPNIDTTDDLSLETLESSNVCVSLLDEWDSSMGLDHVVLAILFLLYHPNPGDALSPYFDSSGLEDAEFEANVRSSLMGGDVDGIPFPRLLVCDDDDAENIHNDDNNTANTNEILMSAGGLDSTKNGDLGFYTGSKPLPVINCSASGSNCIFAELDATRVPNITNMGISVFDSVFLCNPQVGVLFSTFFTKFRLAIGSLTWRTYALSGDKNGDDLD